MADEPGADGRDRWFSMVRANIAKTGHHVTHVGSGSVPRFVYTIGLSESVGHEFVFAGAATLSMHDVGHAIDVVVTRNRSTPLAAGNLVRIDEVDEVQLGAVDDSWARKLLLGASQHYGQRDLRALQIIPPPGVRTIDVPDLSRPYSPDTEPVWQWLTEPWHFAVSEKAVAVTHLDALHGAPICEAARWEEDQWELFAGAGPDVQKDNVRIVPLATLLGFDSSLEPVADLPIGHALWRTPPGPWQRWEKR
jgi:hypothetical protein